MRADSGPVIVIPSRPGVPVIINGRDASYAVVEGDWGLSRPGAVPVTVIGGSPVLPNAVYTPAQFLHPKYGRAPERGRNEVEPAGRSRAARTRRELLALVVDVVRSDGRQRSPIRRRSRTTCNGINGALINNNSNNRNSGNTNTSNSNNSQNTNYNNSTISNSNTNSNNTSTNTNNTNSNNTSNSTNHTNTNSNNNNTSNSNNNSSRNNTNSNTTSVTTAADATTIVDEIPARPPRANRRNRRNPRCGETTTINGEHHVPPHHFFRAGRIRRR